MAVGVGDGLVVVVAHAATRIAERDEERAAEGAERVVHVRSLQSFEVGSASIIRPPGRSWGRPPIVAAGPLWRAMDGALYGSSTFERSVPL